MKHPSLVISPTFAAQRGCIVDRRTTCLPMSRIPTCMLGLTAILIGATVVSPTALAMPTTGWNFDCPPPPPGANNFEIVLPGDQTGIVSANYNSFLSPTHTVVFDGTNTTITFSGSGLASSGPYGPGNSPVPHFGFSGIVPGATSGGEKIPPVDMHWSVNKAVTPVPGLGITFFNNAIGSVTRYLLVGIRDEKPDGDGAGNGADGDETTNWFELPYQGSYHYSFNATDGAADLSGAKFFTSSTEIPLDQLNMDTLPPRVIRDGSRSPASLMVPSFRAATHSLRRQSPRASRCSAPV